MSGGKPATLAETVAQLLSKGELKDDPRRPDYFPSEAEAQARQGSLVCTRCHGRQFTEEISADGYKLLRCASCGRLVPA